MDVVLQPPPDITAHERHAKLFSMNRYSRLLREGKIIQLSNTTKYEKRIKETAIWLVHIDLIRVKPNR